MIMKLTHARPPTQPIDHTCVEPHPDARPRSMTTFLAGRDSFAKRSQRFFYEHLRELVAALLVGKVQESDFKTSRPLLID